MDSDDDLGFNNLNLDEDINDEATYNDDNPFEVLSTNEIVEYMKKLINEVSTVLKMTAATTRLLLIHCKWDKQNLMEKFFEGNREKLFYNAGVVNPFKKNSNQSVHPKERAPSEKVDCEICLDTCTQENMTGLNCGHQFCTNCWVKYLTKKIMDEGVVAKIPCPAHNCTTLVDDESVLRLVEDSKVREKYQHLMTNSFVETNTLFRWCPSPNCNHAIKIPFKDVQFVTCQCGESFCFECGEEVHEPVTCEMFRRWIKKCSEQWDINEELKSLTWKHLNTKDCPACKSPIEKLGGCNHVACPKRNCRHEFCWVCMKKWNLHRHSTGYNCNLYIEKNKSREDDYEKTKTHLERFWFFANRFMNHKLSLELDKKLYETMKTWMEEWQEQGRCWIDVQLLTKTADILFLCRQTLIYTFIFPYFVKKNNQLVIFENNQQDLEKITDKLSKNLALHMLQSEKDIVEIKEELHNKINYCSSRRKALVKHIIEGYEQDWWEYLE